ncbi:MAG: chromosomal replication initiator protein DnaA [Deltaproteobacteria bacterium]|nr:chromosomal replication initiator protein DnaA [Deltaproteobacteria bacterium]
MKEVWHRAKTRIEEKVPDHSFSLWIEPIEFSGWQGDEVVLRCPTSFFRQWVTRHYLPLIQVEVEKVCGTPCRITLEVSDGNNGNGHPAPLPEQLCLPNVGDERRILSPLHTDYTFDQFLVGMCNHFAYNAALSMACEDRNDHAPLYLLSKTGLGKSHLSQAVGNHILKKNATIRVCYVTAEEFTNAMVHALRNDRIEAFKEKYRRQCDVLLLEDVQFLSGKLKTQDELAYTLDALYDAHKKLIFTGSYLPSDIPKMDEKLSSRLSAGVISSIDPPDFETRVEILRKKAALKKVEIPEEVVEYLASKLTQNVRQLESGLIGVAAKASLLGLPIDTELAESVVKNIVRRSRRVTIERIQKLVCKHYKLTKDELVSKSRKRAITQPRQIAMYLARRYTDQSLQTIGRSFNRYHATTLHAIGVVERHLRENGSIQKQVAFLSEKLESGNF